LCGAHFEADNDFFSAILHALHHFRVLHSYGRVGDFAHVVVVGHGASMRRLNGKRRDRTNQASHRPYPRGFHRATDANGDGVVVFGEGNIKQDNLVRRLGRALRQVGKALDHQNFRRDAFGRRGDASPQTQHRQPARARHEHLRGLLAAHPMRHHDLFAVDVVQPVLFHLRQNPVDGRLEIGAAAEARPEGVAQPGQTLPGEIRFGGGVHQLVWHIGRAHARARKDNDEGNNCHSTDAELYHEMPDRHFLNINYQLSIVH
jgi:hypothetical protein